MWLVRVVGACVAGEDTGGWARRAGLASGSCSLRLPAVSAGPESGFPSVPVCFSKSEINVKFQNPPLIVIITREAPLHSCPGRLPRGLVLRGRSWERCRRVCG